MNLTRDRLLFKGVRLVALSFYFFCSVLCLLTFTPFTYTHVIGAGMFPWLAAFARVHPWLQALCTALVCSELVLSARSVGSRSVQGIAGALALFSVLQFVLRPMAALGHAAFYWSQALLLPLVAIAVADRLLARGKVAWSPASTREEPSVFKASAACAGLGFTTYAVIFLMHGADPLGLSAKEQMMALLLSLLLHVTFVGTSYVVWALVRALAGHRPRHAVLWEHTLLSVFYAALFALLAHGLVFDAISLKGKESVIAAISWGAVVVSIIASISVREAAFEGVPVPSGIRLLFSPLAFPRGPLAVRVGLLVAMVPAGVFLQIASSRMDINGLMQKLCACVVWIFLFAASLALFRPTRAPMGRTPQLVLLASLGMIFYRGWRSYGHPADYSSLLEKVATTEPSFGFLYGISSSGKSGSMAELYETMQQNTSLPPERPLKPLDVQFVSDYSIPKARRPNIFIIVVDSLRRDYLSPFNASVNFTPALDAFGKSSDVFENAFTHYGATGLSEPSIWVGGMMPHKQYITPFAPMNSLEKLLVGDKFFRFVTVDSILAQLIEQKSPQFAPLDANVATGDLDLCNTLKELEGKIDSKKNLDVPLFAYTQAQNIHVSTITREGASAIDTGSYDGFYAPYASRIKRIDACFGNFIAYLERAGLYDNSIVVFTADHGDLLGEEGRWGHAYNLNPEVVRIPLIIHRPPSLRTSLAVDTKRVAFSTDISPSLHRLLGHAPGNLGAWFGQSLYGPREKDREWHMLVSSYGPVYGILEEEGKYLYVADAVGYTDTYYEVAKGSKASRDSVPEEVRTRNAVRIAEGIKELHESFHVDSK